MSEDPQRRGIPSPAAANHLIQPAGRRAEGDADSPVPARQRRLRTKKFEATALKLLGHSLILSGGDPKSATARGASAEAAGAWDDASNRCAQRQLLQDDVEKDADDQELAIVEKEFDDNEIPNVDLPEQPGLRSRPQYGRADS